MCGRSPTTSRWPPGGRDAERAARYDVLAAQQALATLAADDAKRLAATALELLDQKEDDLLRCDALICLGQAERLMGEGDHREHLIAAARLARDHADVDRLVTATLANGGGIGDVPGADAERIELIDAALEAVGTADTAERARLLAVLALELGAFAGAASERAFSLADEAVAVARRVGDPATSTFVLHNHFDATLVPHTRQQRLALSAENIALAESLGDPVALANALQDTAYVSAEYGELDAGFSRYEEVAVIGKEFELGAMQRTPLITRASKALKDGRIVEAEALADEAFRVMTETGHRSAFGFYAAQLIAIRRDQGRLDELVTLVADAARDNPEVPAYRTAPCLIHAELDQEPEAAAVLRTLAADEFAAIPYDWMWLTAMCNCAEVSAWLGDTSTAAVLFDRLSPFHDHFAMSIIALGSVAHFTGALAGAIGRRDKADSYFDEAAAMEERAGAVTCLARTRLAWARMLMNQDGSGDAARAALLLDQVLETAASVGLPTVERRARRLLAQ